MADIVPLQMSSTMSTPLEMSTAASQGEERQLMRQHDEKSEEVSTAAVVVARSAPLQKSSMMSTPFEMSTVTSQAEERHQDEPRRVEAAEETARLQTSA